MCNFLRKTLKRKRENRKNGNGNQNKNDFLLMFPSMGPIDFYPWLKELGNAFPYKVTNTLNLGRLGRA